MRCDPHAVVNSTTTNSRPSQPVKVSAVDAKDYQGNPCRNFVFNFDDGTPVVEQSNPVANRAHSTPGTYPVSAACIDRYGNKGEAMVSQRIKDPVKAIGPPQAQLTSNPPE